MAATHDKQRFALSPDGLRIRAHQGHSVDIDLGLPPAEPPEALYHGTARQRLASIRERGIVSGSRQYVHLSPDATTARSVGARHGAPIVLVVEAGRMHASGFVFYVSENGVWLTRRVPAPFIRSETES